jgi:hypothetical protein
VTEIVWHPEALRERDRIKDMAERLAIQTAVEKLEALGERLPFPHQSAVKASKVRELRPRAGRSRWRPLYARVKRTFVILSVGPEAEIDARGFGRAVKAAEQRLSEIKE